MLLASFHNDILYLQQVVTKIDQKQFKCSLNVLIEKQNGGRDILVGGRTLTLLTQVKKNWQRNRKKGQKPDRQTTVNETQIIKNLRLSNMNPINNRGNLRSLTYQ